MAKATEISRENFVNMGPYLRGTSPPFTLTGKASAAASNVSYADMGSQRTQAGHRGILVRWRANRENIEKLLPRPLEPSENTDKPYLFLNQTQTGKSREFILEESPHLMNWHEAFIKIPCLMNGRKSTFTWILYKDVDYDAGISLGIYRGLVNKAADFAAMFPFEGQPLNREMAPGGVATFAASRMGERIVGCSFRASRELNAEEIEQEIDQHEFLNGVGIRYMPDWANPDGAPLVHDLIGWDRLIAPRGIPKAWAGDAELVFGESENEELSLFAPIEMLPSHYIHLEYQGGPGMAKVLHDYVERRQENGRTVRTRTSDMGPHLKGVSPPFSPSGKAAFTRSLTLTGEPAQAGHVGMLLRWRADRETIDKLVPAPLETYDGSERLYCFLNATQTGLNKWREPGQSGLDYLRTISPHHFNWHEALFWLPCEYEGVRGHVHFCIYKDVDHGVPLGMFDGFATKLASFHKTFPFSAQPHNREMGPGGVARATVSRFDERIITAQFTGERELSEDEIAAEFDLDEMLNGFGIRFWPDFTNPGGPPLAHDMVMWDMAAGRVSRAWIGEGEISFGDSEYDELYLLRPLEMLPSYFIHLEYQAGSGTCSIIHDYVAEPIPG